MTHHPVHDFGGQRLANHDARAARAHRKHAAQFRAPQVGVAGVGVDEVDELVDVLDVEGGGFTEGDGVQTAFLAGRGVLVDLDVETVGFKYFEIVG